MNVRRIIIVSVIEIIGLALIASVVGGFYGDGEVHAHPHQQVINQDDAAHVHPHR